MDALTIWAAVGLAVLVVISGLFSATETAFTSANRIKIKKTAEDGSRNAEKALALLESYDKFLTTILVGNNLVNILSSSLCTFIFTNEFGTIGVVYATLFMLIVILAVGEITPKCLAKAHSEKITIAFAPAVRILVLGLTPVTWIFQKFSAAITRKASSNIEDAPTLTEEELMIMVNEIEEEGEIEEEESDLIQAAMEFDDKTVSEILTPRVDIVAVERGATMEEVRRVFLSSGFSRLPVYKDTIDKIVGVIYSKDFYAKYFQPNRDEKIGSIVRRVRFIPESTTVDKALAEIQRSSVQMLIVIDEYGGTVGIVSLEDILEELVGEIWDESDEVELQIVKDSDDGYTVMGDAPLDDLMEILETKLDIGEYDGTTVGGFIQYKLQKVPIMGDRLTIDNVTMIVASVRNRRIKIVKVNVEEPEEPAEDNQ